MPAHINAYESEYEAAKEALRVAQGNVKAAEAALKAHPDYKEPEQPKPKSVTKK